MAVAGLSSPLLSPNLRLVPCYLYPLTSRSTVLFEGMSLLADAFQRRLEEGMGPRQHVEGLLLLEDLAAHHSSATGHA